VFVTSELPIEEHVALVDAAVARIAQGQRAPTNG
jgi:hypothetical protein